MLRILGKRAMSTRVTLANRDSRLLDLSKLPEEAVSRLSLALDDFVLLPSFFSVEDQRRLLAAALKKLDLNSSEDRSLRRAYRQRAKAAGVKLLEHDFLNESAYVFQEAHFDGVYVRSLSAKELICFKDLWLSRDDRF
jgi:hypothetical protein